MTTFLSEDGIPVSVAKYGCVRYVTADFQRGLAIPWEDVLRSSLRRAVAREGYDTAGPITVTEWPLDPGEPISPEMYEGTDVKRYKVLAHCVPAGTLVPNPNLT